MPRYRRPRRQGVVYGSLSKRDAAPEGSLLGRMLGIMVVLGAVALLGVGALTLLGDDPTPPGASPNPTDAAAASPSPAPASPSPVIASPTPAAEPSPTPEPELTPEPTPFAVEIEEGEGHITFGTGRASNLRIADPRSSFEVGERPLYSAPLLETTPVSGLTIEVRKYDPQEGNEELVTTLRVATNLPRVHTVRQRLETSELDGVGIYVMRFVSNGAVMAEGWFELTD